jgi:hypothetical protein
MINLRRTTKEKTQHPDFEYHRGSPCVAHYNIRNKSHRRVVSKINDGYYDFAICWWGDLGRIVEMGEEKGGNYMLIKDLTGEVRKNMEDIDWKQGMMVCTGAPQLTREMFVAKYDEYVK